MPRTLSAFPLTATRAVALALAVALAACTTTTSSSTTAEPTPSQTNEPSDSASASASATTEPSASPSADASPDSTPTGGEPGGFAFTTNAEADSLFLDRFTCQNFDGGYEVDFPAEWNANAEFGGVPPCSWFAATEYEGTDPNDPPDEVAIVVTVASGPAELPDGEDSDRAEGFIGVTQPAYRLTVTTDEFTGYYYVVQLGPTFEEGPNLVARTATGMGGDFDLNRAVLDRMMATMEFIGVVQ